MHDALRLPPIGQIGEDDHAGVSAYLQRLARESAEEGRNDWCAQADSNMTIYTYGADPIPDGSVVTVNAIQNAIIAVTDIQTKEPPAVTLEPVERGEPAVCFWAGPQNVGISMFGLAPQQVAAWLDEAGQIKPPLPLDEQQADLIRAAITDGGVPVGPPGVAPAPARAGAGGEQGGGEGGLVQTPPPLYPIKDEWLVEVNDQLVSDVSQSVFDVLWARSNTDRRIRSNLLSTNVCGWSTWLYEFDDDAKRHILRPTSVKQVYLDPTVEDVQDANYAGVDLVIDAAEAKRLYPHIADAIDEEASDGQPQRADQETELGDAFDRTFQRGMVVMRVFWIRHQLCPYTPEEAVEKGLLLQVEVQDGPVIDGLADIGDAAAADGDPARAGGPGGDVAADDDPLAGVDSLSQPPAATSIADAGRDPGSYDVGAAAAAADPERAGELPVPVGPGDAQPAPDAVQPTVAPVPTRVAYLHPDTHAEVAPGDAEWPTYPCLRQVTKIGPWVVDDRPSEFWDIPILHNVNVPIPGRPWGLGEPYRLYQLQEGLSRVVDAMIAYTQFFKAPLTTMSESMFGLMRETYGDAYLKPGRVLVVPDTDWAMAGGKIDNISPPPPMPEALMQLQPILEKMMAEQSGNAEVLQGRAQPQVKSGRAIELLQSAAASMVGFKSQRTADFVHRLGRLMLHSIIWRMELDDWLKIVSKYPRHCLAAILERARSAEWDVAVTVSSGNGAVLERKKQQAAVDRQIGAISMETYRETCRIDHPQEQRRLENEMVEMARGQAGLAPPGQPAAPQPGGQPPAPRSPQQAPKAAEA